MKEKGWDLGKDEEELLEFSLHKTQYLDYKSGVAKKKLDEDILEKKNSKSEVSNESKIKKENNFIEKKLFHSFELIGQSPSIVKVKKIIEKLSSSAI